MAAGRSTTDGSGEEAKAPFHVPFLRHRDCVGHEEDLAKIHSLLQDALPWPPHPQEPTPTLPLPNPLPGPDLQALTDALLSAFPNRPALAEMVRTKLDKNLNAITSESHNLRTAIFELLQEAQSQGWLTQIIDAAHRQVPHHPALHAFVAKHRA